MFLKIFQPMFCALHSHHPYILFLYFTCLLAVLPPKQNCMLFLEYINHWRSTSVLTFNSLLKITSVSTNQPNCNATFIFSRMRHVFLWALNIFAERFSNFCIDLLMFIWCFNMYLETALQKMYIADLSFYIFFHFMKKKMKHLTKLTLTSTTPEHIGLTNRSRENALSRSPAPKLVIVPPSRLNCDVDICYIQCMWQISTGLNETKMVVRLLLPN